MTAHDELFLADTGADGGPASGSAPSGAGGTGTDTSWSDAMPAVYDRALGPALFEPYAHELSARVAALHPRRVLELAAGTGLLTRRLVDRLPQAAVVATDLNDAMVAFGAQREPRAVWRRADAQLLDDEADASYDVVVCQFGAMFFPDRVGAYREARRVLRPGGHLVLAVWDALERSAFPSAAAAALAEVLPDRTPDFLPRVPYGYADPQQVERELRDAGLQVDPPERVLLEGRASSADVLAEGFCLGTPLRAALDERGDLQELVRGVEQGLRSRLGEGPLSGELAAWVVLARRAQG